MFKYAVQTSVCAVYGYTDPIDTLIYALIKLTLYPVAIPPNSI